MDPAILAVFGSAPDGINLKANRAVQNDAAAITVIILALIAVIFRFIARSIQRAPINRDDWVIILALLFVMGTVGMSVAGGAIGAGKHIWATDMDQLTLIFKVIAPALSLFSTIRNGGLTDSKQILYSYTYIYAASCASTKISILLFYQRIFPSINTAFRLSVMVGYFLSFSYPLIIWVTMANCCKPLSHYWNQFSGAKGKCIDVNKFFLALGIINMLNDVIILSIPIPLILSLQLSLRKKVAVTGILLLGGFVCVASALRIYYLTVFSSSTDLTWVMGPVFIWSAIEPSIGIVCACLPHLAPLWKLFHLKVTNVSSGQKSGANSAGTPWRSTGAQPYSSNSRFAFGGDKMMKLGPSDDEIGLTNQATAGSTVGKPRSSGSGSEDNINGIIVKSTFVQTVSLK
ncbi:pth11-like integral membrane protein [Grosmannia clavigera kw1407]|uniref:Pth11-like integral membrane protein n=1 Tax=Grosmannia clavigera (strain kw1407 / UAMH 11150) TaxID=655863 RepID=F0X6M8_GROCL|nr:pth11-like integral membrane protein [Grosmannia clavigera kw1407]EFX06590.1 pth11-like integral membrane protein [Grosmannia clavigera kw1407]